MASRLLPQSLPELYAHALNVEREATKRFAELEQLMRGAGQDYLADEFERIGNEEREQYEALAFGTQGRQLPEIEAWEYAWHYMGSMVGQPAAPKNAREALALAISTERRAMCFYADVAEHCEDDTLCAFAAEMATDEARHVQRLEMLLAREPVPAPEQEDGAVAA
jgi:rubrerythrin